MTVSRFTDRPSPHPRRENQRLLRIESDGGNPPVGIFEVGPGRPQIEA